MHLVVLVAVNGMDDGTGAQEEQRLEHSVGEQVEHRRHVAQAVTLVNLDERVVVGANSQRGHHEGNLGNGREGQRTLDVALGAGDGSGIERRERANDQDDVHRTLHEDIEREEPCHQEHTGHNHRGGVNQGRHGGGTLHSIGQPDVQRVHRTLTGTADEDEGQRPCHHRAAHEGGASGSADGALGRFQATRHRGPEDELVEVERLGVIAQNHDTQQEEQVSQTGDDECLLVGMVGSGCRVIETDEQVG